MNRPLNEICSANLAYSHVLLEEAQGELSNSLDREVSIQETSSMLTDMAGFFGLLHEWDLKDKKLNNSKQDEVNK